MLFQHSEFESPPALTAAGIKVRNIKANSVIDTPPWTLNKPEVNFSLTADKKDNTDAFIFKTKFQEITSHYLDFKHIYTDGTKDGLNVAAACVSRTQTRKCRLPDNASFSLQKAKPLIWLWITFRKPIYLMLSFSSIHYLYFNQLTTPKYIILSSRI